MSLWEGIYPWEAMSPPEVGTLPGTTCRWMVMDYSMEMGFLMEMDHPSVVED